MKITFCGHSNFISNAEIEQRLLSLLEALVGDKDVEFYLGGYGNFDAFAYHCCKKYKIRHKNASLIFVTPYITPEYQKNHLKNAKALYDMIIYPEIDEKPRKYALSYRNKYMVEVSDFVIAYVKHDYGGAYKTLMHAKRKGKVIFNLAV